MNDVDKFLNTLLKPFDVVVLGCSGGPDSMCLLDKLIKIRKKMDLVIVVAHVNHNVRRESVQELKFLRDYCNNNDVFFESMKIEKYGDDNFHNEARTIRYNFFEDIINKYHANYLMTAHHGDDLIETVLMRIVRGSTLSGYSGFAELIAKNNYKLVRPLIYTTKDEISAYNKKNNIPYVVDKSNFKSCYTRNRYRKVVLPFLKKEDINVHKRFLKYSKLLIAYDEYIGKQVKLEVNKVFDGKKLKIDLYNNLDDIIKDKILYYILEQFYQDDLVLISDAHVGLIKKLILSKKSNSYIYLPNNIKVIKSYNDVFFGKETSLTCDYEIEIDDYVHLPNNKVISVINEDMAKSDNNYCRLSSSNLSNKGIVFPLSVRTRRSGDKILVKGMNKYKKVKDIFINAKIPMQDRDLWPIVVDSTNTVVWIPGIKKSQFDIPKSEKCDIILWYH